MRYYVHAITGILLDKLPVNGLSITSLENQKIKVSFFDKGTMLGDKTDSCSHKKTH